MTKPYIPPGTPSPEIIEEIERKKRKKEQEDEIGREIRLPIPGTGDLPEYDPKEEERWRREQEERKRRDEGGERGVTVIRMK